MCASVVSAVVLQGDRVHLLSSITCVDGVWYQFLVGVFWVDYCFKHFLQLLLLFNTPLVVYTLTQVPVFN